MTGSSRASGSVLALLVLGAVVLGVRATASVQGVLVTRSDVAAPASEPAAVLELAPSSVVSLDGTGEIAARDPFEFPRPERRRSSKPPPRAPKPEATPTLRALLYDTVEPGIRIDVGTAQSDWLRTGETFRGWNVTEITPSSATLTDGKRTVVVGSSRER